MSEFLLEYININLFFYLLLGKEYLINLIFFIGILMQDKNFIQISILTEVSL